LEYETVTPSDVSSQSEGIQGQNLKALAELTNQLIASFGSLAVQTAQSFAATMANINNSLSFNLDLANKRAIKWMEYDPQESAAEAPLVQAATKAAQTIPPVTGTS
jgi:hypothetical protein